MIKSVAKFTIRVATGIVFLTLNPLAITSPASASGYCITYRHWVGWADYYGVPWTYSDFFDNPYVYRCRVVYRYTGHAYVTSGAAGHPLKPSAWW